VEQISTAVPLQRSGVGVRTALRRAATGLTFGLVGIFMLSQFVDDLDLYFLSVLAAVRFLHEGDDRHANRAALVSTVTALLVTVGLAVLLKGWLSQPWSDITFAVAGALAGAVAYAYTTGRR
jgi:1,4-dihydroxy-2-naphthoate octaprenyltransferase